MGGALSWDATKMPAANVAAVMQAMYARNARLESMPWFLRLELQGRKEAARPRAGLFVIELLSSNPTSATSKQQRNGTTRRSGETNRDLLHREFPLAHTSAATATSDVVRSA